MTEKYLKSYVINEEKLKKFPNFYRHFEIIEHENITHLGNDIYHVKSKFIGINGTKKSLANLVVNKLIYNELSFELNRTPSYCRYDYSSGINSIPTNGTYFQVIPIGDFNAYQSDIIADIGQKLCKDLPQAIFNKILWTNTVNDLDKDTILLIEKYVKSYKKEKHKINDYEVLLDCESFLLLPIKSNLL